MTLLLVIIVLNSRNPFLSFILPSIFQFAFPLHVGPPLPNTLIAKRFVFHIANATLNTY